MLVTVSGQSAACRSWKTAVVGFCAMDVKKKLKPWDMRHAPRLHDMSESVVGLKYRRWIAVVRNLSYVCYRGRILLDSPRGKGEVVTVSTAVPSYVGVIQSLSTTARSVAFRSVKKRWSRSSGLAFSTLRGFKPGRSCRIFKGEKILSTPSFGGEVKPSVPCRRFTAGKRTLECIVEVGISRQNYQSSFSPTNSSTFRVRRGETSGLKSGNS